MRRLLTALVLIPAVTAILFLAHPLVILAVMGLVACLCLREYSQLVAAHGIVPPGLFAYGGGLAFLLAPRQEWQLLVVLALLTLVLALRQNDLAQCLPHSAAVMLGIVVLFGAWRCGVQLRTLSPHWLFFALALNWVGDSAAFYVGRSLGRHRLAPRVSPKKSWEGAIASLLAAMLLGGCYLPYFLQVPVWQAVGYAAAGSIAGQVGDLAESAWKRGGGIKDSGTMLPGHGGWLDRLDSTMFTLPVLFLLLSLDRA